MKYNIGHYELTKHGRVGSPVAASTLVVCVHHHLREEIGSGVVWPRLGLVLYLIDDSREVFWKSPPEYTDTWPMDAEKEE